MVAKKKTLTINDEVQVSFESHQLTRNGQNEEISPRGLQILQYLIEHRDRLVTFEELTQEIWQSTASESAQYQQIANLRKALGDNPRSPQFIKTIPKKGYRFIGKIDSAGVKSNPLLEWLNHHIRPAHLLACIFMLIAVIAITPYIPTQSPGAGDTAAELFASLPAKLKYPKRIIALHSANHLPNNDHPGLMRTIELIIEHHLDQLSDQHVTLIPKLQGQKGYKKLDTHFDGHSTLTHIITPGIIQHSRDKITLELGIYGPQNIQVYQEFSLDLNTQQINTGIYEFEKLLIEKLATTALIPPTSAPFLNNNPEINKLIIESAAALTQPILNFKDVDEALNKTTHAISLNPSNLMAYTLLWEEMLFLMNTQSEININAYLDTMSELFKQATQINPGYHKTHYAKAEYYCWIQDFNGCAEELGLAIRHKPYDPLTLLSLSWNLRQLNKSTIEVDTVNYNINPLFKGSLTSIYDYYRNTLVSEKRFTDIARLVTTHSQWHPEARDWYFESQYSTDLTTLNEFAQWYQTHYGHLKPKPGTVNNDLDSALIPSRYLGFMLLNANQPELAKYWAKYGAEQHQNYFDYSVIGLLADIWQGQWKAEQWLVEYNVVEDRSAFQNVLDKLRIMYFHYYNGLQRNAEETLLEIFPEFADPNGFKITADNFRYAVYYADIHKRQRYFGRSRLINQALSTYLSKLGNNIKRDIHFGVADAEFYALNGEQDKALAALKRAVMHDGWLPNAIWLWPPLEHNPFLKSLHEVPEFQAISQHVKTRIDSVCFSKPCRQ